MLQSKFAQGLEKRFLDSKTKRKLLEQLAEGMRDMMREFKIQREEREEQLRKQRIEKMVMDKWRRGLYEHFTEMGQKRYVLRMFAEGLNRRFKEAKKQRRRAE